MDRQSHEYASAMSYQQQLKQHLPPQLFYPQIIPPQHGLPPHHLPPQQQPPYLHLLPQHVPLNYPSHVPLNYPPHLPSHVNPAPFVDPFDTPPPPAMPSSDSELEKIIDKLAGYSAKNGPEFEAMVREKQQDNPGYSFLFGGEGHHYYWYKIWLYTHLMSCLLVTPPPMHQPSMPPLYFNHQPPYYDPSIRVFKGLSGPLPSSAGLNGVLSKLTGTKEPIRRAKPWFMQRAPFAPALAEALRERVFAIDDSEGQLHIISLANDILFESLQRRANLQELDNEALTFKPVLGSMLSRVYHNPHNMEANRSRLEKILQFWASKEVYDQATIASLEREMFGGQSLHAAQHREINEPSPSVDSTKGHNSDNVDYGDNDDDVYERERRQQGKVERAFLLHQVCRSRIRLRLIRIRVCTRMEVLSVKVGPGGLGLVLLWSRMRLVSMMMSSTNYHSSMSARD